MMTSTAVSVSVSQAGHTSVGWVGAGASVAVLLGFMLWAPWLAARVVRRWKLGDDSDDGNGFGGGGGGGSSPGPTPPNRPPDAEPAWWPEFEHEFASYVERIPIPG